MGNLILLWERLVAYTLRGATDNDLDDFFENALKILMVNLDETAMDGATFDTSDFDIDSALNITIKNSGVDHNLLANFVSQEHLRWDLTGAEDIHIDRIPDTLTGKDADTLDGSHASAFALSGHNHSGVYEPANANIQTHISSTSNPHSTTKTHMGLSNVDNVQQQPLDATLTSLAALGTAADKLAYTTGSDTWAETAFSGFGRSLVDDADAAAGKTTLELNNVTNDAQLKRVAGDLNSFSTKATPVNADVLILEDSADSYVKKKILWSQLPAGGGGGDFSNGGEAGGADRSMGNTDNYAFALKTNDNDAIKMHENGIVDLPKQSRVRAWLSSTQSIPNNTWTIMVCQTENYDEQSEYNTSTGRFQPKEDGYYLLAGKSHYSPTFNGQRHQIWEKNATSGLNGTHLGLTGDYASGAKGGTVITIEYLLSTDYVEFFVHQDSGSARSLYNTRHENYICIHKLS